MSARGHVGCTNSADVPGALVAARLVIGAAPHVALVIFDLHPNRFEMRAKDVAARSPIRLLSAGAHMALLVDALLLMRHKVRLPMSTVAATRLALPKVLELMCALCALLGRVLDLDRA
eukprot:1760618-Prymnesium_polylepis.2